MTRALITVTFHPFPAVTKGLTQFACGCRRLCGMEHGCIPPELEFGRVAILGPTFIRLLLLISSQLRLFNMGAYNPPLISLYLY